MFSAGARSGDVEWLALAIEGSDIEAIKVAQR
jgi:hypothetical protein